jgi:Ca2+-binding RTX toxin-like protein
MTHASKRTLVVFGDSLSDNGNLFNLIGLPQPPAWEGRFSNGPNYAEQLASLLNMSLDDRAYGFAEASDTSPPLLVDPPHPINLSYQVGQYIAGLDGKKAPPDATALINIGSNDYDSFFFNIGDPSQLPGFVQNVVGSIASAIASLTGAGFQHIVLYTLPDFGITPDAQLAGVADLVHQVDLVTNSLLKQVAAAFPNVKLVDAFELSEAVGADPTAFGFNPDLDVTWTDQLAAGTHQFAPNELAFFDGEHPTSAGHSVLAEFSDATLTSDAVQFLDGTQSVVHAGHGNNFIFATPPDPTNPALNDNYTIYGGAGTDLIFAGSGDVTVHGGSGTELIEAGSGNANLYGGNGTDVIATNSLGHNLLVGGNGDDALIANRGGSNTIEAGKGNTLIVLKEDADLVSLGFGTQTIVGGPGHDTLRFIVNDQIPESAQALMSEFQEVEAAFDASAAQHHRGTFQVDGLNVTGIDGLQLQVDSVSTDPATPYLITHDIVASDGTMAPTSDKLTSLLTTASNWGLLTV